MLHTALAPKFLVERGLDMVRFLVPIAACLLGVFCMAYSGRPLIEVFGFVCAVGGIFMLLIQTVE